MIKHKSELVCVLLWAIWKIELDLYVVLPTINRETRGFG
jgi:hypothetical protein